MITKFSKITGFSPNELLGRNRRSDLVTARQLYWKLLRERKKYSYTCIARLNDRHHATILQGIRHVDNLLECNDNVTCEIWGKVKDIDCSDFGTRKWKVK